MSVIVAIAVFIAVMVFDGPFILALFLGGLAWFVMITINKGTAAASPAEPAVPVASTLEEKVAALTKRVSTLEGEVARLSGKALETPQAEAPKPPPPVATPPAPQPVELQPSEALHPAMEMAPPPAQQEVFEDRKTEIPPEVQKEAPVMEADAGPSLFSRLVSGNIVAKVGAIVLFFGVGFLLKFAYDRNIVPPGLRLAGVAAAAAVALFIGLRLMERRRIFGMVLQGVASGLAYLDVYFALKIYSYIGATTGFVLFAALGVATTLLAVRQDAAVLAVLGLTGAFMAPVLASTGEGNHVALFSYYLLLNLFILAVSWFKAWRALNLTGWFFTFAVAVLWGWRSYRPELFGSVEPFLLAFFAIYLVIPMLFATRQPPQLRGWVDGTLVFGTPAAVAVLQGRLVWDLPYGLAWSCAAGSALYAVLAAVAFRQANMRLLAQTYIALAVGLGTLAIFYAFGAYTTFALWTIEGAALLWVCLRQGHFWGRVFALLVQAAGALYFLLDYDRYLRFNPWFNDAVAGCVIIAAAAFLSAWLYRRYGEDAGEAHAAGAALPFVGAVAFIAAGVDAFHHGIDGRVAAACAAVLFVSAGAAAAELLGAARAWPELRRVTVLHPVALFAAALASHQGHPLEGWGWVAWPAGLGSLFWMLHRQRRDGLDAGLEMRYAAGWILLAVLATWEAAWWLDQGKYAQAMAVSAFGYLAALLRFILREHGTQAWRLSTVVLAWALFFWLVPGLRWIDVAAGEAVEVRVALGFVTFSAAVYWLLSHVFDWPALRFASRLLWLAIPAAVLLDFAQRTFDSHPFDHAWALAWPAALGFAWWSLRTEEQDAGGRPDLLRRALLLYPAVALATWELAWWVDSPPFGTAWRAAAIAVPASLALLLALRHQRDAWPLSPLVFALGLWALLVNARAPGTVAPLPAYLPLLNPLDLALALAAAAVIPYVRGIQDADLRKPLWLAGAALGFVWLNAMALRTLHYWLGIDYELGAMMKSLAAQATLSILWTTAALALMTVARMRMQRSTWLAGAALLGVVVVKLFVVDLANTGTVERIVSFLGVGVILLVIGYVAPVPPGVNEKES